MEGANSAEFDPETPFPVIDLLPEQKEVDDMGGTMRLGADPVKLHADTRRARPTTSPSSTSATATATRSTTCCAAASRTTAWSSAARRPTTASSRSIELPDHPFFMASQYHPEFKSRPNRPEPMFREFVGAALERARERGTAAAERARPSRTRSARSAPSDAERAERGNW